MAPQKKWLWHLNKGYGAADNAQPVHPSHITRRAALMVTPASNWNYLIGAGKALGHFAANVTQVVRDSAYGALPAPLKVLETHVSTLAGQAPVLHQVNARNQDRREGVAAFASNPIGVTEKAALGFWNAFADNDGSAASKQRAGAAAVQTVLLAAPPLNTFRLARPLPQSTTLYAKDLGLSAKYVARSDIRPLSPGHMQAKVTYFYDLTKSRAPLVPIFLTANLVHRGVSHKATARRAPNATRSGALLTMIDQLKRHAALTGNKTLALQITFLNEHLARLFRLRYRAQRLNTRRSLYAFNQAPTYVAHIPIGKKFAARAQHEHRAAVTHTAITWHGIAAAAHDTPLPALKLPTP